jgi:hypothetical protein
MIKTVYGTTELGFLMTANGGDSNKYFCDRQYLYDGTADSDSVWTHGGASNSSNTNCGIFCAYTR